MTATYNNNGDGTSTLSFIYTSATDRILTTALDAAHYLWLHGYGPQPTGDNQITFDDVTAGQRLTILDTYVRQVLVDAARTYSVNAAIDAAREAAQADDIYVE